MNKDTVKLQKHLVNIWLTNCSDKIAWQRRTWYRNGSIKLQRQDLTFNIAGH